MDTKKTQASIRRRIMTAHRLLIREYGEPRRRSRRGALSQLIATILSQNTTDLNTDRAFANLRAKFSTWEAVRDAPPSAVVRAIRSAGLANTKAPRIQAILRQLTKERGALSLNFLRAMPVAESKAYLLRLKGVGPKTASIVLLFTFGQSAFPVDTHIFRVTKRLGWIPPRATREQAHEILAALAPPEIYYPLHLNLIAHGRAICKARNPKCAACVLRRMCDYYRTVVQGHMET
jgi:endonuclease-3